MRRIHLDDVRMGARLLLDLPVYFRASTTPKQARHILRRRFERREADFVTLVRRAVFGCPGSPYHRACYPDWEGT